MLIKHIMPFVHKVFVKNNKPVPTPEQIGYAINLVLNYFNTKEGAFWIFYNSDIQFAQDLNYTQYMWGKEEFDSHRVLQFYYSTYDDFLHRMDVPNLEPEEQRYLVPEIAKNNGRAKATIWACLMWFASPEAEAWRIATNNTYASVKRRKESLLQYKNHLVAVDDMDTNIVSGGECRRCGEYLPCVSFTSDHDLCAACKDGAPCPLSDRCYLVICEYNNETLDSPVASTGRRYCGQ